MMVTLTACEADAVVTSVAREMFVRIQELSVPDQVIVAAALGDALRLAFIKHRLVERETAA
jgi:hypothetical protein